MTSKDRDWMSELMRNKRPAAAAPARKPDMNAPISPKDAAEAERLCERAAECRTANENDQAVELYEQALALNPKLIHGWLNLAIILREIRRPRAALECLKTAQSIPSPNDNFGVIIPQLMAICEREVAAATGNEDAEIWLRKGWRAQDAEQWEDAIAFYERARSLDPHNGRALVSLGVGFVNVGRAVEALDILNQAQRLNDPETREMLSKVLPTCRKIAAESLREQGAEFSRTQQWAEALNYYDRALELDPYDSHALCLKGVALLAGEGLPYEALTCFEAAERLGHPNAPELIAECRKYMGDQE